MATADMTSKPLHCYRCFHLATALLLIATLIFLKLRTPTAPPSASSRLGNLDDFRFLLNSASCRRNHSVFALLLVGSQPDNHAIRDAIRHTWGNPELPDFPFRLAFLCGVPGDRWSQLQLDQESAIHGDIVQGSFVDDYFNATLRDLMGLRWARLNCPQARFVVHAEEDISLDPFRLIDVLQRDFPLNRSEEVYMACTFVWQNASVIRKGKYALGVLEHPEDVYDDYCFGWLYVVTPRMAAILDDTALGVRPYWLNDAYVTGTLIRALNMTHRKLNMSFTQTPDGMQGLGDLWVGTGEAPEPEFSFGLTDVNVPLKLMLHQYFKEYAQHHGYPKLLSA